MARNPNYAFPRSYFRSRPERIAMEKAVPASQKVAERILRRMNLAKVPYLAAHQSYDTRTRWARLTVWWFDRKDEFRIAPWGEIRRAKRELPPLAEAREAA